MYKNNRVNINDILDNSEIKPIDKTISNTLYGFNRDSKIPLLESNKDQQGYTFFVKPQLNLSTVNIRNVRQMYPLLSSLELSPQRFVRLSLDPRLQFGIPHQLYQFEQLDSPLVDKFNPFIPVLSNTLMSMSGWPDMGVPTFTSPNGLRKEQISMVDGTFEIYDSFEIDCTFKNFINEPLTLMFQTWIQYAALVFEGMLYPYIDFITENEFDYNTRIYRFVMDKTGRYIKRVAATGAAFPVSVPTGKFFDYDRDKPYSDATNEINIRFKAMGAMYNDDILFREFNNTVAIFNPEVRAYLRGDPHNLEVIPYDLLNTLNFRGYPIVDLETYELKWLINKNSKTYQRIIETLDNEKEDNNFEENVDDFDNDINFDDIIGFMTQNDETTEMDENGIMVDDDSDVLG